MSKAKPGVDIHGQHLCEVHFTGSSVAQLCSHAEGEAGVLLLCTPKECRFCTPISRSQDLSPGTLVKNTRVIIMMVYCRFSATGLHRYLYNKESPSRARWNLFADP